MSIQIEDSDWIKLSIKELKEIAFAHYSVHFQGRTVVNEDSGDLIVFTRKGIDHHIYARKCAYEKLAVIKELAVVIQKAKLIAYEARTEKDNVDVLGYKNYECIVTLNGKKLVFGIHIQAIKNGKTTKFHYYDINLPIKQIKP